MTFNGVYNFPTYVLWCDCVDNNEFISWGDKTQKELKDWLKAYWKEYEEDFCVELTPKNGLLDFSYCHKQWFLEHNYNIQLSPQLALVTELI